MRSKLFLFLLLLLLRLRASPLLGRSIIFVVVIARISVRNVDAVRVHVGLVVVETRATLPLPFVALLQLMLRRWRIVVGHKLVQVLEHKTRHLDHLVRSLACLLVCDVWPR